MLFPYHPLSWVIFLAEILKECHNLVIFMFAIPKLPSVRVQPHHQTLCRFVQLGLPNTCTTPAGNTSFPHRWHPKKWDEEKQAGQCCTTALAY